MKIIENQLKIYKEDNIDEILACVQNTLLDNSDLKVVLHNEKLSFSIEQVRESILSLNENEFVSIEIYDGDNQPYQIINQLIEKIQWIYKGSNNLADLYYINSDSNQWNYLIEFLENFDGISVHLNLWLLMFNTNTEMRSLVLSLNDIFSKMLESISVRDTVRIADLLKWHIEPNVEKILGVLLSQKGAVIC